MARKKTSTKTPAKVLNLALQGGGSHGAYTWGVLDRLLQEEDIHIEGVSGTSAGAMNAAIMVSGYALGGREMAREKLDQFWRKIADAAAFNPLQHGVFEKFIWGWEMIASPILHSLETLSHMVSPYDSNPLNINPLRSVLEDVLDLEALRGCKKMKCFIAATHVESGQPRVFSCQEMSMEVVLASACLPQVFQAVEIDGEHYWDGGYMGNPVIWPLIYRCESEDVLLVQINPIRREGLPKQPVDIMNRLNEISFNSSLIAEMRAIDFVSRLIHDGKLDKRAYKDLKMHLVYSPEEILHLTAASKMNANIDFLERLHDIGYRAMDTWLAEHKKDIGVRNTLDIREKFLTGPRPGKKLKHVTS